MGPAGVMVVSVEAKGLFKEPELWNPKHAALVREMALRLRDLNY